MGRGGIKPRPSRQRHTCINRPNGILLTSNHAVISSVCVNKRRFCNRSEMNDVKMHRCDGNATMSERQIDTFVRNTTRNLMCGYVTMTTVTKLCSPGTVLQKVSSFDHTQFVARMCLAVNGTYLFIQAKQNRRTKSKFCSTAKTRQYSNLSSPFLWTVLD